MNLPPDLDADAVADVVTNAALAADTGRYVIVVFDPQVGSGPTTALGPFDDADALMRFDRLTADMHSSSETADVVVSLVPWETS